MAVRLQRETCRMIRTHEIMTFECGVEHYCYNCPKTLRKGILERACFQEIN